MPLIANAVGGTFAFFPTAQSQTKKAKEPPSQRTTTQQTMDITTTKDRRAAHNSGLAKGGLTCFDETLVLKQTFVLCMNISAKNPALRQAANR